MMLITIRDKILCIIIVVALLISVVQLIGHLTATSSDGSGFVTVDGNAYIGGLYGSDSPTYKLDNDVQIDTEVAAVNTNASSTWQWVRGAPLVNPNDIRLEYYGGGRNPDWYGEERFEGKFSIYSVSNTSFAIHDRHYDRGEFWNVNLQTNFDEPDPTLTPGDTVNLTANFTHGGTVTDGNPGVRFWYSGDGISMQPSSPFNYFPWQPDFGGASSATYSFVVPQPSEGATIEIYASWWNAPPCLVVWRYDAVAVAGPTPAPTLPANQPPVCSFTVTPPNPISADTLLSNNTSYDPDGDVLTYAWYVDGGFMGDFEDWQWPNPDPGTYTITLEVEDGRGGFCEVSRTITVGGLNRAPECSFTLTPDDPTFQDTIRVRSTSSDPDDDYLTYSWYIDEQYQGDWDMLEWPNPTPGTHTITLVVEDEWGASSGCSQTITVTEYNRNPVCSFTITPDDPTSQDTVAFNSTSHDPDEDTLTYSWSVDGQYRADTKSWSWSEPPPGEYTISLVVSDGNGGQAECSQWITVTPCPQVMLEHILNAGIAIGWAQIRAYWYALAAKPPLSTSEANEIIENLTALRGHLDASGFPFDNYDAPIDSLIAQLRTGVRTLDIPEGIGSLMVEPGGLQAQLRGKTCTLPTGEVVWLEHIFNAGIRIGWTHIRAYWYALAAEPPLSTSDANDVIEDLTALRGHLDASGFPFDNYDAPINSLIEELGTGVRTLDIPEAIGSLMVDPGGLQAQLRGERCNQCEERGEPTPTPTPTITPTPGLPTRFDWRDEGWFSPVRNQGACGSCWAFAAVGAVEGTYWVEQKGETDLSEQNLVSNCYPPDDCSGGWPHSALEYIKNTGVVDEPCFPYLAANSPCNLCADSGNRLWKMEIWDRVPGRIEDIKEALISHGPLSVTSLNWMHAVVLVGYDDDSSPCRSQYGQDGCWTIRNSWGLVNGVTVGGVWHDNGYGYIPYTGHAISDIVDHVYYAEGVISP